MGMNLKQLKIISAGAKNSYGISARLRFALSHPAESGEAACFIGEDFVSCSVITYVLS